MEKIINKGFKYVRKVARSKAKSVANCFNCRYNKPNEDGEEECSNTNVTKFDVFDDGTRRYCNFWLPEGEDD